MFGFAKMRNYYTLMYLEYFLHLDYSHNILSVVPFDLQQVWIVDSNLQNS